MIIDTNVYSAIERGKASAVDTLRGQTSIYLPFIVVGELRDGFMHGSKRSENEARLTTFLAQDTISIIFPTIKSTELYAELSTLCRRAGRLLSHNDLWIATLAYENEYALATYDKDFEVFRDILREKLILLSN